MIFEVHSEILVEFDFVIFGSSTFVHHDCGGESQSHGVNYTSLRDRGGGLAFTKNDSRLRVPFM